MDRFIQKKYLLLIAFLLFQITASKISEAASLDNSSDSTMKIEKEEKGKIVIGGTGDSQKLLEKLARAFEVRFNNVEVEVPESIGSSGGIKALSRGSIHLARVARELSESEKALGLTYRIFATSPIVFVTHPSVILPDDNLKTSDIIGIYSGKITRWEQIGDHTGKIYPIIREKGDSSLKILMEKLSGFKEISEMTGKIVFTTPETVEIICGHRNTIGFLPYSMTIGTGLSVLKVDGISPSFENVSSDRYKLVVPFGIVFKGKLEGILKDFIDFLYSSEGKMIIREHGTVPAG